MHVFLIKQGVGVPSLHVCSTEIVVVDFLAQEIKAREMEELARTLAELGIEAPATAPTAADGAAADAAAAAEEGKKKKKKEKKKPAEATNGTALPPAEAAPETEAAADELEEEAVPIDPAEVRGGLSQSCSPRTTLIHSCLCLIACVPQVLHPSFAIQFPCPAWGSTFLHLLGTALLYRAGLLLLYSVTMLTGSIDLCRQSGC